MGEDTIRSAEVKNRTLDPWTARGCGRKCLFGLKLANLDILEKSSCKTLRCRYNGGKSRWLLASACWINFFLRRLDPSEFSTKLLKPPDKGWFVALSLQFDGYYQFACRLFWCLGHEAAFFRLCFLPASFFAGFWNANFCANDRVD